jgi:hypothetical protein
MHRTIAGLALVSTVLPWFPGLPVLGDRLAGGWFFAGATLTLGTLLFLPGYAVRCFWPQSRWAEETVMPVPGMLSLGGAGLLLWVTHLAARPVAGAIYLGLNSFLAAILLRRPPAAAAPPAPRGPSAAWFYGAAVVAAGAYAVIPLPVAQEFYAGTTQQTRMVASPPDANIPFITAAYFHAGYGGRERSDEYFAPEWSVTARGPLVPFMIATGLNLYRAHLADPPVPMPGAGPLSADGYFVARILGVLTNAAVILGADALLVSLGVGGGRRRLLALAWITLAPVTLINVVFLWPKLLAGYFILLAAAAVLRGGSAWVIASWAALGYLSHPVAGLFFPALGILRMRLVYGAAGPRDAGRKAGAAGLELAAKVLVFLSPWIGEKIGLRHSETFLREALGDGHGFRAAASGSSWLAARASNVWQTFVPFAFYFSSFMHEWVWGPVSPFLRWLVQDAKTLPAGLGFSCSWMSYLAVLGIFRADRKGATATRFAIYFLLPAAASLLLFWGFSRDGLGRDCLEPLSVLTILWTVSCVGTPKGWMRWLLAGLWVEGMVLTLGGIAGNPSFALSTVTTADWALAALVLVSSAMPLSLCCYWWPRLGTETPLNRGAESAG